MSVTEMAVLLKGYGDELAQLRALGGVRRALFFRFERRMPARWAGLVRVLTVARSVVRPCPRGWMRYTYRVGSGARGVVYEAPVWLLIPFILSLRWRRR